MFYKIAHAVIWFVYRLVYRFRVTGRENVPQGGAVVCGNHTSLADPVLVALALRTPDRPYFMAKAELFKIPVFKSLIKFLGAFPVRRGEADLASIKHSLRLLKDGKKLLVFPWGKRVRDGDSAEIKNGAAMLANRSGSPLLPVYISHGRKLFVNKIDVRIGRPVDSRLPEGMGKQEFYSELADGIMADIQALGDEVAEMRRKKRTKP